MSVHFINIEKNIALDKLNILYKNLFLSVPANFVCATIEFISLYSITHKALIISWYFAVILISLLRIFSSFYHHYHPNKNYPLQLSFFILGTFISALLWGLTGFYLMPAENLLQQMVTVVLIAGITAGGVQSLQPNFWASILYVITILLPLITWFFLHAGTSYFILAIAFITYLFFMLVTAWHGSKILENALKLRYENLELIKEQKENEIMLIELNKKSGDMVTEMQLHEIEMDIINKMNDKLQICQNFDEAYSIIHRAAVEIFSEVSGAIYVVDSSHQHMEIIKQWGDQLLLKNRFEVSECWGLREGHYYLVNDPHKTLACKHYLSVTQGGSLCMPQIVQTGLIGMLVLLAPPGQKISHYQQKLATTFNDEVKLALANLHLRESLRQQSIHDPLTGLYNRRYLDELLTSELQKTIRENQTLCVAMLDVDFFKRFNDIYGHEAGDTVLKLIGGVLEENFRGSDIACRFGGEEFVLVLVNSNLTTTFPRMQMLCNKIKNTKIIFQNQELPRVTLSIGLAEAPNDGVTAEQIIRVADEALYRAKNNGRDRIEIYVKELSSGS